MLPLRVVGVVIATFAAFRLYQLLTSKRTPKGLKKLPGPKGYPYVGSALDFPKHFSYSKLREWGKEFGPIYMFTTFGIQHVVITKHRIADELLAHKGAIYSERRMGTMGPELVNHYTNPLQTRAWPKLRKLAQAVLSSPSAINRWRPWQEAEASRLVYNLLKDPDRYVFFFELFSSTIAIKMCYGKDIARSDDETYHVNTIMEIAHATEQTGAPGTYLVDILPSLKYLPEFLAGFKAEARYLSKMRLDYFGSLLSWAHKSYEAEEPQNPPCFAREYLQNPTRWALTEPEAVQTLANFYEGGAGTTSATMQGYCLAMCHYPDWQVRLQLAVDDVVGPNRLPTFDDLPNLPMVRAVAKEILRWRPVVPGGIPHCVEVDDDFEGYHIPKGAVIHANFIAMTRDEEEYPDSETFNPDRWLSPEFPTYREPLTQFPNLKRYPAFGYGRRICPGLEAAENSLFIEIATVAWACNISVKKDSNGIDIPVPWWDYLPGNNTAPRKFQFSLKSRGADRTGLVETKVEEYRLADNPMTGCDVKFEDTRN